MPAAVSNTVGGVTGGVVSNTSSGAISVVNGGVLGSVGGTGDLLGGLFGGSGSGGLGSVLGAGDLLGGLLGGAGSSLLGNLLGGNAGGATGGLLNSLLFAPSIDALLTSLSKSLIDVVSNITSGIKNIITNLLTRITDSSLANAVNSAYDVIVPAVKYIVNNLDTISSNISAIINEFNSDKNSSLYAVVNEVGAILAPVVDTFNKYYANNSACFEPSRIQILSLGEPMQQCIADSNHLLNVTDYADYALSKIDQIAQIARDVKCAFIECVLPAIITPTDSTTIVNAMSCVKNVSILTLY